MKLRALGGAKRRALWKKRRKQSQLLQHLPFPALLAWAATEHESAKLLLSRSFLFCWCVSLQVSDNSHNESDLCVRKQTTEHTSNLGKEVRMYTQASVHPCSCMGYETPCMI